MEGNTYVRRQGEGGMDKKEGLREGGDEGAPSVKYTSFLHHPRDQKGRNELGKMYCYLLSKL